MARFATLSDEQLKQIITDKDANETKKQTEISWNILLNYCREKSLPFDPNTITKLNLDKLLGKFYAEVRKQNGELYKKTSFNCIRYSIQRKMKSFPENFDTIGDPEFGKSNEIFKAQCVHLKKAGLCQVNHHPPISREDLSLLYSSDVFSIHNPTSLQKKVFFDVMLHFCRRGGENLRKLTKAHFVIKEENGVKFVEKNKDELTKNHRENHTNQDSAVMMATGNENCPVASFIKYSCVLNPKLDAFFQRPKKDAPKSGPWYDNMVLGEKSLLQMMKKISENAHLSTIYTNHSIRATTVTILDENYVASRHIMSVSGHRSETSIRSYSKTNKDMKRKMSSMLSDAASSSSSLLQPEVMQPQNIATKSWKEVIPDAVLKRRCFDFGVNLMSNDEPSSCQPSKPLDNIFPGFIGYAGNIQFVNCTFGK